VEVAARVREAPVAAVGRESAAVPWRQVVGHPAHVDEPGGWKRCRSEKFEARPSEGTGPPEVSENCRGRPERARPSSRRELAASLQAMRSMRKSCRTLRWLAPMRRLTSRRTLFSRSCSAMCEQERSSAFHSLMSWTKRSSPSGGLRARRETPRLRPNRQRGGCRGVCSQSLANHQRWHVVLAPGCGGEQKYRPNCRRGRERRVRLRFGGGRLGQRAGTAQNRVVGRWVWGWRVAT
jgi:hypothetical protein